MTADHEPAVAILGLGAMGGALATAVLDGGRTTTVWNRSAARIVALAGRGAIPAETARDAVRSSPLLVVCLFDHDSVHAVLDPIAGELAGRTVINLTTTTPVEARELAEWAARQGAAYLDGGIMAVPAMIGQPDASVLYSGSADIFHQHRSLLDLWVTASTWVPMPVRLPCMTWHCSRACT